MHSRTYRFGRYRIDPTRHKFWDGDEEISLQLKVFESLVYLIEHRDRAVCRDELISAVWGKIDVNDHTLTEIIRRSRVAVGDSGDRQAVIRTVPGFGYCWVQPVEEQRVDLTLDDGGVESCGPDDGARSLERPKRYEGDIYSSRSASSGWTRWPWAWPACGVAGLLMVTATIALLSHNEENEPAAELREQIALVLPVSVPEYGDVSWMRLGLMDLIAERFRQLGQSVIPSDNVVALVGDMSGEALADGFRLQEWMATVNADWVVQGEVKQLDEYWYVSLRSVGPESQPGLVADGQGRDVFEAIHAAIDHLTASMGYSPGRMVAGEGSLAVGRILNRAEAAHLAGHYDEAIAIINQAGDDYVRLPEVRLRKAIILASAGRFPQARQMLATLDEEVGATEDQLLYAQVQYGLGLVSQRSLDYQAAGPYYDRAIASLDSLDHHEASRTLGRALSARATIRGMQDDFVGAREDQSRARIAFESTGDRLSIGRLEGNLAILLMNQGRYADALPHARRALDQVSAFGDVASEQRLRLILSTAESALLDSPAAATEAKKLAQLIDRFGSPSLAHCASVRRMETLFDRGKVADAEKLLSKILDSQPASSNDHSAVNGNPAEVAAARKLLELGRTEEAVRYAEAVLDRHLDEIAAPVAARIWLTLFRARLARGEHEMAGHVYFRAMSWAGERGYPLDSQDMALLQAEHAVAFEHPEAARQYFEQALARAQDSGIPSEVYRAAGPYVRWLIEHEDLSRAGIVAGLVAPWADRHFGSALLQVRLYHAVGDITAWHNALERAQKLAGERQISDVLMAPPVAAINTASK